MSNRALVIALVGSFALIAGGGLSAQAATPPRASLTAAMCQTALDPPARGIAVTAVMRPVTGTQHMQVKFELLRARHRSGVFRSLKVKAGSLGKWISPRNPTLGQLPADVWEPVGEVANLQAPGYYRLRVTFRWLDAGEKKLAETIRSGAVCYQPELRADLSVRSITVNPLPNQSGVYAYDALLANRGSTAAGPFDVQLAEAQNVVDTESLAGLAAHHAQHVRLLGAACTSGELITVTADPAHQIDVSNRLDGTLSISCPATP